MREEVEETLYSSYFTPQNRPLTQKEKIDAFIIGRFTLAARERYEKDPASFSEEMGNAQLSLRQTRNALYELYGISDSPLEKIDQEIKDSKYNLLSDLFDRLPLPAPVLTTRGVISALGALKEIENLEMKRKFLQAIDLELPTSSDDIQKAHILLRRASQKLPPEFSTQVDAYHKEDNMSVSVRDNLNDLISHNPMIKNQFDLLIASGQIDSLEQLVLVVKKNIEDVEMTIEQQQKESVVKKVKEQKENEVKEIKAMYEDMRRATAAVSNIVGFFDPKVQVYFNKIANPLMDMSEAYSVLNVVSAEGFKFDLNTLSTCATGIGAVFALANFFIGSSQPSEMEILMEHLNGQFEKLHERFDKLHEHIDFVHRDLTKAVSELSFVMQKRFDTIDIKLEEIKRVLNAHKEKLKVIEDLIREHRNETRNIEMDKDRFALDESIRRYQDGMTSQDECLFDCVTFAEATARRRPHLRDAEDNQSDIRNGFFHKVLEVPYFVNLSQLLNLAYPDLPRGSEPRVGVYEYDEYDQALQELAGGMSLHREIPFTVKDIKNIETWADGANTYLQQVISAQRERGPGDLGQRTRTLGQIDQFLVSGKKLKRSVESIFYELNSEFEKISVQRDFVAKLFRDYIAALSQIRDVIENKKSRYYADEKISNLDISNTEALHTLAEAVVIPDSPFSPILSSELKAAILLGIGQLSVSYESPRRGVVEGQEGRLLFNVIFKFQEGGQESKIIGAVTIASHEIVNGLPDHHPQEIFDHISTNDLTNLVIGQIKNPNTPNIQEQYRFHWDPRGAGSEAGGVLGWVHRDEGWKIYTWNGFDRDSTGIYAKTEEKRKKHAGKIISEIAQDIKNESAVFEKLEGQKALLEAYLSLGLTQSFASHAYLKSFFNHIFSHGLMDKEEVLSFLSQSEKNPSDLFKEGLLRAKRLSCLLLGKNEGARAVEVFATLSEESCGDETLYSAEGLLAERINSNELPHILNKTLRRLYRAQKTFSVDLGEEKQ